MPVSPELLKQLLRKQKDNTITDREMALLRLYLSTPEAEDQLASIDFSDMPDAAGEPATSQEIRFQQIMQKIPRKPVRKVLWYRLAGVAAVALVMTGIGMLLQEDKDPPMLTLQTSNGELKEVILPDSSRIFLNARSAIRYPASFSGKTRTVQLLQGQAYFDVTKQEAPFIVESREGMQTIVLGTTFTVMTDSIANHFQVAVKTGKVRVERQQNTIATLLPGDGVFYDFTKSKTTHTDPGGIGEWTSGEVRLSEASFAEMANLVKQLYGITVIAGDAAVQHNQYNLPVKYGTDLRPLMEVICMVNGNRAEWRKDSTAVIIR
ncbi:FecR domain-containing protein [Chitinophaga niabensis]|uniref:FecR family protein n=1 Tax=Chitinophaga niabensis TaxID=536979 RepID=UPI0031BB6F90